MFEQRLREQRRACGMTQDALAARLFVSRQTVSSWETGRNLPNLETLSRLAALLNVSTDYLLGRPASGYKAEKFACLPTALAILAIVRFAVGTTRAVLWWSDVAIMLLIALWFAARRLNDKAWLNVAALLLGFALIGSAWGQIFGMALGYQLAYVVAGALLVSETTWQSALDPFRLRSDLMNRKAWWIGNGVLGVLAVSGCLWILLRRVDGTGHVENIGSRLAALGVLGLFIAGVGLIEFVVRFVSKRTHQGLR